MVMRTFWQTAPTIPSAPTKTKIMGETTLSQVKKKKKEKGEIYENSLLKCIAAGEREVEVFSIFQRALINTVRPSQGKENPKK